jgi:pimeloyl-ACP methyl ester carboxylesterase
MFATPGEQLAELTKQLRQRGYAVLRMMAHPSRFTENIRFFAPTTGDLNPIGSLIADELTNRAAEAAYAVEAALAYVYQERPALRSVKRAAIGTSGGAMILPTVLAREPHAWAAHVSIGGGADYLRILATSNYTDWIDAAGVIWTPPIHADPFFDRLLEHGETIEHVMLASNTDDPRDKPPVHGLAIRARRPISDGELRRIITGSTADVQPTAKQRQALFDAYRSHATLDSANLAPRIAHIPTLMIVGTTDRAVPAATAQELWTLLGKPERWQIRGGHEWLFLTLPRRFPEIVNWLDARLSPEATPSPSAPIVPPTRTDPAPASP